MRLVSLFGLTGCRQRMFCGLKKNNGRLQTADGRHNAAFTLLELVIVLAIIGLVTVMTVPGFVGMMRGRHLTSAANLVHAALNGARNIAVTQRKPYGLVFDIAEGKMGVFENGDTSNPLQRKANFLPQVVSFDTTYDGPDADTDPDWNVPDSNSDGYDEVIFRPDGSVDSSTSPVIVIVSRGGEHMYIRVVRNTGQVVIE